MSTQEQSDSEFTPAVEAGVDQVRDDVETSSARQHRFRRARPAKAQATDAPEATMSTLQAELLLLREENAWLKAAQHQTPGIGHAIQRVRALPGDQLPVDDDKEDSATQILVEAHVLRESLLELCSEMQRALATVRGRIDELAYTDPDDRRRFDDPLTDGQLGAPVIHINGSKQEVS